MTTPRIEEIKTMVLAIAFGITVPITAYLAYHSNAWAAVLFAIGICFAGQLNKPYIKALQDNK